MKFVNEGLINVKTELKTLDLVLLKLDKIAS